MPLLITFKVEIDCEHDGRWIAEVNELPGVLAYGERRRRPCQEFRLLGFGSSPSGWSTVRPELNF